jgi:hypothetical protein
MRARAEQRECDGVHDQERSDGRSISRPMASRGEVAAMISVDTLTAAAAPGVRNPAMSQMPLRMARSPRAHDVAAGSALCAR